MADLNEEKKKLRAQMGRPETTSVVPPPTSSIVIQRPERKPLTATGAGVATGNALNSAGGFVGRGFRQINDLSAAPTRFAVDTAGSLFSGARDFAGGVAEGMGFRREIPPASLPPASQPANEVRLAQERAAKWEGKAGLAAKPNSVIDWKDGNASGSFVVPAGRSTPMYREGLKDATPGTVRRQALQTVGASPDRMSLRDQVLAPQQVETLRGGQRATDSFVPGGFENGPRLEADGTYTHAVGPAYGGYQRVASGSKDAYYDSQEEIAPGRYGAFRNARTGALFGSMEEAGANNPIGVTQGVAQAAKDAAEANLMPAKANELNARAGYYAAQGRQSDAAIDVSKAEVQAIREGRGTKGRDATAAADNKWQGIPQGVADLFKNDMGEVDGAALSEFSQFAAITGNRDSLDAFGEYQAAKKAGVPLQALQFLLQNPDRREEFRAKYGWLPSPR